MIRNAWMECHDTEVTQPAKAFREPFGKLGKINSFQKGD